MSKRVYLFNILSIGSSERDSVLRQAIDGASDECVNIAYEATLHSDSQLKIIYLLGGNSPANCPFK